jgi:hypothetical protein
MHLYPILVVVLVAVYSLDGPHDRKLRIRGDTLVFKFIHECT